MPKDWPAGVPGSKPRKKKGSSGKGNGTTVGMSIAIFGSAFIIFTGTLGYVLWMRFGA